MPSSTTVKVLMCALALVVPGIRSTATAQDRKAARALDSLVAEADYLRARLDRVNAEIALAQSLRTFDRELEAIDREVALAESDLKQAEEQSPRSRKLSDKIHLQQKVFAFEQAQLKKKILQGFTRDKTIKGLQAEIEKARSVELSRETAYEEAKERPAPWRSKEDSLRAEPCNSPG